MKRAAVTLLLAALAATASAQETPPREMSLSDIAAAIRPGGPTWQGRAEFPAAPGAAARLHPGAHAAGDVIAEIAVAPSRTARLLEAVTLTDATHGARTIPAGATLFARNSLRMEVRPGQPPVMREGSPLQWCVLDEAPLCITMRRADAADYTDTADSQRVWHGPAPALQEEPVAFDPPLIWRFAINQIDPDRGVSFTSTIWRGDQHLSLRGYGFLPNGTNADLTTLYPNLRFRPRVEGEGRVLVEEP